MTPACFVCSDRFRRLRPSSHFGLALIFIFMSPIQSLLTNTFRHVRPVFGKHFHRNLQHGSSVAAGSSSENDDFSVSLRIETMEDMEEVGALLSVISDPPDVFFLDGDLGAGKTTFSRGFIRCKLGLLEDTTEDIAVRVTSPTYLLSNTYTFKPLEQDSSGCDIHHIDLYRLSGDSAEDFAPLHLDHVFNECISLVEWPSRLFPYPPLMPPTTNLLNVDLSIIPSTDERVMKLCATSGSTWIQRLKQLMDEGIVEDLVLDCNN